MFTKANKVEYFKFSKICKQYVQKCLAKIEIRGEVFK